ncbi:aldehyde dehydrogenase family protein [Pseudophaeobacter flagellatus]|uniref:aldehyde dehydrogenase family protein n=1 Tax=Pseudophaeobacter flagellatus TaxID=2899119 RepID=UPI001E415851|nr:aldehyde dehydrogenase family protein [Pseudophaeobacter flagellatus]MCD9146922.1 aldehyde dehydrogenase family protein [Pseudophaeobacter flagellatus]
MSIKEIFETMDYGPAPESAAEALAWLVDQGDRFGHFINGSFTAPGDGFDSRNPATSEVLATLSQASQADVDAATSAARSAQPGWEKLGGPGRARFLYAIARLLQKHARLFAVLETMDNGKPIRESRDIDIPLAQRHFYYHAGMAQLMEAELPGAQALGVCGQIIPWNFPLLMLAWKVAPALAMGNTVVLKPAEYTSLTALLFADICQQAGLPKGVVNIVTGDGAVGEMIVAADVDKIAFTGSTSVGRRIREATAGTGKALTLELGGKSPYIVFDDADLDSAVEGLVDAIWFNQGQVCCAGSRLLVQEGIADQFYTRLKARMDKLRLGSPLDKSIDIGAVVDPVQLQTITALVAANQAGETYQPALPLPSEGCFFPPTLIQGLAPSDPLMQEEIFGPVLVSCTFRTPAEAVELANNSRYGLAATVWSENINLALDLAPKLVAGVVWINGTNMFDAAAGFGGVRESGFGREGGWEGLSAYTRPKDKPKARKSLAAFEGKQPGGNTDPVDRTAKMYIGGKQARPDSGYSKAIYAPNGKLIGHVGQAGRKDIRNAVEAAASAKAWSKTTGHLRAQILYYIGENLSARATEFANRIDAMTGKKTGVKEVETTVERLFTAAAWADKYDGQVHGVPMRAVALAMKEPVGVIGALCPDEAPLLGLVSLMAPALAMGNRVVLAASAPFPLAATDFFQVLETSDVPAGVVNILTGDAEALAEPLAAHMNVDAVWSFASADLDSTIEQASALNLKRTWIPQSAIDWSQDHSRTMLRESTEVKNIWVPYGE